MTTELRMTPQTGTTATTSAQPAMAIRKATKDPADTTADQFAAMFAALCLLPLPQPTPAAKHEEAAPAPDIAIPEVAGSDTARETATPLIALQTPILVGGQESIDTAPKDALLPVGPPATSVSSEQTLNGPAGSAGILPASFVAPHPAGKMPVLPEGKMPALPEGKMPALPAMNLPQIPAPSAQRQAITSTSQPMEEMTPPLPATNFQPAAKPQEPVAADTVASPQIAGSDDTRELATPVITLQTPISLSGQEALPKTAAKDAPLPLGPPDKLFSSEQTLNGLPVSPIQADTKLAGSGGTLPVSFAAMPSAGKIPAPPAGKMPALPAAINLQAPVVMQTANNQVGPIKPGPEPAPPKIGFRATVEADVVQNPRVGIGGILPEPTLVPEAAPSQGGMVGRYFPGYDPGSIVPAGGKTLLAGNGFNLGAGGSEADAGSDSRLQFPTLAGEVSFASTVRDLESDASATSIQSQTISQILAQAETLTGRQTRSLRLRLRPEELGEIDIQLSRDAAGRISAHISAERESARVALSRSLDQLRDTLSRAGLTVDKLQINAEPGLFAGNRENNDAGTNTRQSSSGIANFVTENETEAGGQAHAEDEKLLSLHA